MASLDTNVLVRWLVNDDPAQSERIKALFSNALKRGENLFVPITVALELEWVLRSRYGYAREELHRAFDILLDLHELDIQFEEALELALQSFQEGKADFADCLHLALSLLQQQSPWLTFDARAARLDGAMLLESGATPNKRA